MGAQKWLGMRLSKLDIFGCDNRAEAALKPAVHQNMPDFFSTRTGRDCQRTPQGCGLYRRCRFREQYGFIGDRLEIVNAFTPDWIIELPVRQGPPGSAAPLFTPI